MKNTIEMTPEELRLAIAKAKGWDKLRPYIHDPRFPNSMEGLEGFDPTGEFTIHVPNWPTSITDAWTLVEEMKDAYFVLTRTNSTNWAPAPWGEVHWECRFYAPAKGNVSAETAPLAICLAWLIWKESN